MFFCFAEVSNVQAVVGVVVVAFGLGCCLLLRDLDSLSQHFFGCGEKPAGVEQEMARQKPWSGMRCARTRSRVARKPCVPSLAASAAASARQVAPVQYEAVRQAHAAGANLTPQLESWRNWQLRLFKDAKWQLRLFKDAK